MLIRFPTIHRLDLATRSRPEQPDAETERKGSRGLLLVAGVREHSGPGHPGDPKEDSAGDQLN